MSAINRRRPFTKNKINFLFWFHTYILQIVWFNLTKKSTECAKSLQMLLCYSTVAVCIVYSIKRSYLIYTSSTITKNCCYWIWLDKKKSSIFLWLQQQHTEHMCGVTISSSRPIKSYFGLCTIDVLFFAFLKDLTYSFAFGLQSRYINWKFLSKHINQRPIENIYFV